MSAPVSGPDPDVSPSKSPLYLTEQRVQSAL